MGASNKIVILSLIQNVFNNGGIWDDHNEGLAFAHNTFFCLDDRNPQIVDAGRLQDDPECPNNAGRGEDPEKESIQDQGYVFPILLNLELPTRIINEKINHKG